MATTTHREDPVQHDDFADIILNPPAPPAAEEARELAALIPDDSQTAMLTYRDDVSRAAWVRESRTLMRERVRQLTIAATTARLEGPTGDKALAVTLAPEARLAADVIETLKGVQDIAAAGIEEAKTFAEGLLEDRQDLRTMGSQSVRFPVNAGAEVKIGRTVRTATTVDTAMVLDVLRDRLRTRFADVAAAEEAISVMARLLKANALSATAVAEWSRQLGERANLQDQEHALRLTLAVSTAPTGNPSITVEHVTAKGSSR